MKSSTDAHLRVNVLQVPSGLWVASTLGDSDQYTKHKEETFGHSGVSLIDAVYAFDGIVSQCIFSSFSRDARRLPVSPFASSARATCLPAHTGESGDSVQS